MVSIARRPFSVEEYHRMIVAGILTENDRVELIQGEILNLAPIGSRHAACVDCLSDMFHRFFLGRQPREATVRVQNPILIGDRSEPEPDVALVIPRSDFYSTAHPSPNDVLLLVEVSDTTGEYDRGVKVPVYAEADIREVWIVDLVADRIEVYREPVGGTYRNTFRVGRGESLHPEAFPDLGLAADRILG